MQFAETRLQTLPEVANCLEMYQGADMEVTRRKAAAARQQLALVVQPFRESETGQPFETPEMCCFCGDSIQMFVPSETEIVVLPCLHAMHKRCMVIMVRQHRLINNFGQCPAAGCKYTITPLARCIKLAAQELIMNEELAEAIFDTVPDEYWQARRKHQSGSASIFR